MSFFSCSPSSGQGGGTVTVTCDASTSSTSTLGSITVKGVNSGITRTVSVTLNGRRAYVTIGVNYEIRGIDQLYVIVTRSLSGDPVPESSIPQFSVTVEYDYDETNGFDDYGTRRTGSTVVTLTSDSTKVMLGRKAPLGTVYSIRKGGVTPGSSVRPDGQGGTYQLIVD